MNEELIQRYQPGGDLWATYAALYGNGGAGVIAQAAKTGQRGTVTDALTRVKFGERLSESTLNILYGQLTTDPFAAPLAAANAGIGTIGSSAILGLFKNPWVLAAVVIGVILWAGGGPWLGRQLKGVFK